MSLTLEEFASYIGIPAAELKAAGVADLCVGGNDGWIISVPYHDTDGRLVFRRTRASLNESFIQPRGTELLPFGLDRLAAAREAGSVVACEGESDTLWLWHNGISAIGLPGARSWRDEWSEYFDGLDTIHVVQENDRQGGAAFVQKFRDSPLADRCRVVRLPAGVKDVLELGKRDPAGFAEAWEECIEDSTPIVPRIDLFRPYTSEHARADAILAGEGISTGIASLDAAGFQLLPGNVWSFAGRQGGGKTALLLETTLRHVEASPEACALFVSFEGSRYELYLRLLARQVAIGRVEDEKEPAAPWRADVTRWLKTGQVFQHDEKAATAVEWEAELERAAQVLDGHLLAHRLVLIDGDDVPNEDGSSGVTASRIMDALRLAPRRPTLATFDYWQKLTPANRADTRYVQLKETADRLRRYAKGDGDPSQAVVVLTAAQVNREAKDQPGLEHIRESDDLGNDGAGVVTLRLPETEEPVKKMHLKVVKNRFGPNGGRAELLFYGGCGYFAETDTEAERQARTSKTRERIRADVERLHAKNPAATKREARAAVRGNNGMIDEAYREVFGSET